MRRRPGGAATVIATMLAALLATTACAAPTPDLPRADSSTTAVAPAVAVTTVTTPDPTTTTEVLTPSPTIAPSTIPPSTIPPSTIAPSTIAPSTPPPTTIAPTTSAPTTIVPTPRRISMAFSGDILPHSPLWRGASRTASGGTTSDGSHGYDFVPMLAELAPLHHSVDLAVCHLETPIAPAGEAYSTMPYYGVPAEVVDALAASGFGRCSTASNHTVDRGIEGISRTVDVLEAAGIGQSGMARTPAEIEPVVIEVGGVAVSHLSYTWSYNGLRLPEGDEWRSALIDPARILADVATARGAGAEVVVVSLHWGTEQSHDVDGYQRRVADELTAAGTIDLIVGHHAHVLQPIEQVNGTWVLFGLGNLLSNHPTSFRWPDASQDAAVVVVGFTVDGDGAVGVDRPRAYPTWVDKDAGWVVRLVAEELARNDLTAGQRNRLERSLTRTLAIIGDFVLLHE
jgi:hypothetical protein